jgi:eukaryotic-like serine/threonine-protein kinase
MANMTENLLPPRYTGVKRIASGGMGDVYSATDTTLGRAVAVKLLGQAYASDVALRGRFTREALAAARLSGDRSIVTIYDVGEWDERPYIVMQYLDGGSLEDFLQRHSRATPARALDWLDQAAHALDHAHDAGIVHRDVKPANLLLDANDNVHVADFGIASAAGLSSLTSAGTVLGTAGYLAPEQAQGEKATPASDRYALGIVAFELLTGRRPYENESPTAEMAAHVNSAIPSVSAGRDLPRELDAVFTRALAKRPADRYPTAAEFVSALRDAFAADAARTRPLATVPLTPARRRGQALPLLAAIVGALAIAGVLLAALLSGGTSKKPGTHSAAAPTTHATTQPTQPATTAATTIPTGDALNLRGYNLLQAGNAAGAVPILQQAVAALRGHGPTDPNEGFANYNLAVALMQLGQCAAAIPYLQAAQALEPGRAEVQQALDQAQQCVQPPPHGNGKHKGKKKH